MGELILTDDDILVEVHTAGEKLGIGRQRIVQLADEGKLPTIRTLSGQRLFRLSDVERLRRQRAPRRTKSRETLIATRGGSVHP